MTHHRADRPLNASFITSTIRVVMILQEFLVAGIGARQEVAMAEVLVEFSDPITDSDGITYTARACGSESDNGHWQGWIEFTPVDGGRAIRSGRETTQPNRTDALYWATGLTHIYLEGALQRALNPLVVRAPRPLGTPAHSEPAPAVTRAPATDSILNPFSVYRKGEGLLRQQLRAFSPWHLVNIVRAHDLSSLSVDELNLLTSTELIELIVSSVRSQMDELIS
jgi:hypothetical protein